MSLSAMVSDINAGGAGGRVYGLAGGTYNVTGNRNLSSGGSSGNEVVIRALDTTNRPLFNFTSTILQGAAGGTNWDYAGFQVNSGANYIKFYDLDFKGDGGGGAVNTWALGAINIGSTATGFKCHHIGVYGCRVYRMGAAAFYAFRSDYIQFVGNDVWYVGYNTTDSWSSGIGIWRAAWLDTADTIHNVFANNRISGCYDAQNHTDGNGMICDLCNDDVANIPPTLIVNNLLYGNGALGFVNTNTGNTWVVNNTIYKNALDASYRTVAGGGGTSGLMILDPNGTNSKWFNNVSVGRAGSRNYNAENDTTQRIVKNIFFGGSSSVPSAWNSDATKVITTDPLLKAPPSPPADASTQDQSPAPWTLTGDEFTLQVGSPGLTAGVDPRTDGLATAGIITAMNSWVATDLRGAARATGSWDLGAYQATGVTGGGGGGGVQLVGSNTVNSAGSDSNIASGQIDSYQFTATATGTLTALRLRTSAVANTGVTSVYLAIYADNGSNAPGTRLGFAQYSGTPPINTWIEVTGLSVSITSGTVYWIAALPIGAAFHYLIAYGGTQREAYSGTGAHATPPNPFGSFTADNTVLNIGVYGIT